MFQCLKSISFCVKFNNKTILSHTHTQEQKRRNHGDTVRPQVIEEQKRGIHGDTVCSLVTEEQKRGIDGDTVRPLVISQQKQEMAQ